MNKLISDLVKSTLAVLLVANIVFTTFFLKSRRRSQDSLLSQSFMDCSIPQSQQKHQTSPFWTESQKYMNVSHRAKRAMEIFLFHEHPRGLIVDIGSGFQALRREVPNRMSYKPVDLFHRVQGTATSICNLNRLQFPFFPGQHVAAYFFLGSFEYILDKMTVLRLCRRRGASVIMQYNVGTIGKGIGYEWVAPFSMDALKEAADIVGYNLVVYDNPKQESGGRRNKGATFLYFQPL